MSGLYSTVYTGALRIKAALRGDRQFSIYRSLLREQYLPPHRLEQVRIERFKKLALRAIDNSKYYHQRLSEQRELIEKMQSLEQLSLLPLLTRDDLQQHYKEILCPVDNTVYADSSGGSTGSPVNFYHDRDYQMFARGLHLLFMSWIGVSYGDRTGIFWGADRDFKEASFREKLDARIDRIMALNSFNVDEISMDSFLRQLEQFNPTYIYGYASSLALAAERINQLKLTGIRPKAVRSSAEMLYESQRQVIEQAFGTKVYNFYGSREINNLAAECAAHEGMHVMASGRIIEVVDDNGQPVPDGEQGNLAVTDLTNLSFPFIRYLTGDMGTLKSESCSCGISYPLLAGLAGRSSDIISFNGLHIHGEYFTHLFYAQPLVKQFQVIQEEADLLVIKIVLRSGELDTQPLLNQITEKVGPSVRIEIEFVDSIPPLKSGKFRFTINNYNNRRKV
ncbi:MAG: hypothetical protein P1R58_06445 [bacterium]|nr:hypothetical protein [bacterium]